MLRKCFEPLPLLVLTLLPGCGSSVGPALAPVHGTITYRGRPLEDAQVVFHPETPGTFPASGYTDKSGRYQLMTMAPRDGAGLGKHRVTVVARGPDKVLPEGELTTGLPGSNTAPGDALIPQRYFSPETSDLTAEVTARGIQADFDLKE